MEARAIWYMCVKYITDKEGGNIKIIKERRNDAAQLIARNIFGLREDHLYKIDIAIDRMVDNATPIGGPNGTSLSSDHTLANGGHVESVEWLKALYKLREANTTNELRAQSQRDLYSAYLKHKLKAISDPQGSGGVSAPSSLASLHERNTLLLEDALKVVPPSL